MATRTQAPPKYTYTGIVSARIDRDLIAQLDAAARAAQIDRNTLIERLIRAHMMINPVNLVSPMTASSPPTLTNGHAARLHDAGAGIEEDGQPDPRDWYIDDDAGAGIEEDDSQQ